VWSSLKSPVCRIDPCGVSIATAIPSGIEWVTWKNRIENGPIVALPPGTAMCGSVRCVTSCSSSLPWRSSWVNAVPTSGIGRPRSRRRYGRAPTWSSWPWVRTTASTSSARSRTYSMSGSTRSIPNMSADGNDRPTSRISSRPSSSRAAMFRPTSPIPPRKTMRPSPSAKESGVLQRLADALTLVGRRGDERQSGLAARSPDHLEGGLERDRVGCHEQGVEQRRERLVDLARRRNVPGLDQVDHLPHRRANQVTRDADDADGAEADVPERRPVVSRVDLETVRGLRDQPRDPLEVSRRVLDRHDVRLLRETKERLVLDPGRGSPRDVVRDDREVGRVGDVLEVGDQSSLGRLV